jgi:hypothetical protein
MTEYDEQLMTRHGITAETKVVFHYAGHRYDRLADAVNYATAQAAGPVTPDSPHDSPDHDD